MGTMKQFVRAAGKCAAMAVFFGATLAAGRAQSGGEEFERLQAEAAKHYSEQSYALAHRAWSEAAKLGVPEADRATLDFYLADSLWRSRPDAEQIESARAQLGKLAGREVDSPLAAEAAESLADSWLAIGDDWEQAWKEYRRALKFWAAQTDLEAARPRYLGIVWKATGPPSAHEWSRAVPLDVLANALEIAPNDEERARAHFFLGAFYARDGDPFSLRRARREFSAAVEAGASTAVYEAALFRLAWLDLSAGKAEWRPDGQLTLTPDYERALDLFRRFAREFPEGKSPLFAAARDQIAQITRPQLEVEAAGQFLPGVKPVLRAAWRNVGEVTFAVSRVDLLRDFQPDAGTNPAVWLDGVKAPATALVKQWKETSAEKSSHALRTKRIELGAITEPGTYLVEARSGAQRDRALIVVTEAAAIFNNLGEQAVAFFCDARSGARAEKAAARLWQVREADGKWRWTEAEAGETRDGLVRFELPEAKKGWGGQAFLFGAAGRQPTVTTERIVGADDDAEGWRVQVFTDRAAYRPGDKVNWKLIARRGKDGSYATPAGEILKFVIVDPNGDEVDRGEVKLTAFGGAWGALTLKPEAALGEYEIAFQRGEQEVGGETLFRLEEYRLPEFKVGVALAAGDSGRVRLGDEVEVKVSAEYYFGGAVADAKIEVQVREEPYARPLPWEGFWAKRESGREDFRGASRVIKTDTVRTGPDGTATLRFPTPLDARSDQRYSVEARVTDASGREVVGSATLVVGRQSYFAELKPGRRVGVPGDKVAVAIETQDGNRRKIATKGRLAVTRQRWTEVWLDPQGREVSGEALDRWRQGVFPPAGEAGWRLVRQEYVDEKVGEFDVATDERGCAAFEFQPKDEGFYRLAWSSPDAEGPPVTAETHVWVSSAQGGLIGYRSGGVEIVVDPEAPARGGKVPVLLTTDTSNRDVLFMVHAGGNLFRAEVVHLAGNSKLIELEPREAFVPNVFVSAAAMRGLEYFADSRPIKFPPTRKTLAVEMRPGAAEALPGAESTVELTVKDAEGRPVRGEFALAISDEAIEAIQEDYAGDPVEFFWGKDRPDRLASVSSVSRFPFFRGEPSAEAEVTGAFGFGAGAGGNAARMRGKKGALDQAAVLPAALPEAEVFAEMMMAVEEDSAVTVRSNFSATAFWSPSVFTNESGAASVKFRYPDSLTTWKATLRGATTGAEFGFAEQTTRTTLPLIARLQAPRFLVAGDRAELAGVVNNRTGAAVSATVEMKAAGLEGGTKPQTARVPANGDVRVAWKLAAAEPGRAELTLTARAGKAADAMTAAVPIHPNGIEKTVVTGGKTSGAETKWSLVLPAERRRGSEELVITATPSLAAAALDAIPYLAAYPYGCVEQTMSRFLPAAVTARTLQSLGLDRGAVANRIYGGVEREFLSRTHPKIEGAAGLEELDAAVAKGLARLMEFQHGDGAWGWWKDDESDPFMTAYVVWGLRLAQQAGVPVRSDVMRSGGDWLRKHLADAREEPNLQAWLLHALAAQRDGRGKVSDEERAAVENLWAKRDQLTAYGRALFALSAHAYDDADKAQTLVRNLRDGVRRDAQPGVSAATGVGAANPTAVPTAHWGSEGMFRRWQDGGVEATAFALQALLAIDPKSDLVEPAMNWLVKNRRGAQWSNTRDTAIVLLAMNRYLAATKELGKPATFEIAVNGQKVGEAKNVTALDGQTRFAVDRALLRDGENEIALRGDAGSPPIYLSARAEFFTLEQPIPAAGNEIFVKREYSRFSPQRTLLDGYRFDREPWKIDEPADRDQRIEVTLTIEAKNDLEYVLVEDLKPAGLEAVNVQSGGGLEAVGKDGKTVPVYCELRDRKVALFLRRVPQGVWTIRYELRTETAGDFSALPVMGGAMYAPEIRANGESRRVEIR